MVCFLSYVKTSPYQNIYVTAAESMWPKQRTVSERYNLCKEATWQVAVLEKAFKSGLTSNRPQLTPALSVAIPVYSSEDVSTPQQ